MEERFLGELFGLLGDVLVLLRWDCGHDEFMFFDGIAMVRFCFFVPVEGLELDSSLGDNQRRFLVEFSRSLEDAHVRDGLVEYVHRFDNGSVEIPEDNLSISAAGDQLLLFLVELHVRDFVRVTFESDIPGESRSFERRCLRDFVDVQFVADVVVDFCFVDVAISTAREDVFLFAIKFQASYLTLHG